MKRFLLLITAILSLAGCRPELEESREAKLFQGTEIAPAEDTSFDLRSLNGRGVVVNIYSPTCVPCIDELPALHVLYEEAKKRNIRMYLALEGRANSHGIEKSFDNKNSEINAIAERMQQDIQKYGIEIPVVILDGSLRVHPKGLVTATPETLFFKLNPAILLYNFIGPVSSVRNPSPENAPKLSFAIQQLDAIVQRTETYNQDSY